ncbi:MAG: preprotein translocase subunit SecG [Lachnospiraceae bacterium]|nr:preprotein translocase subunit SecG [Lachnospiraceae bacterium]
MSAIRMVCLVAFIIVSVAITVLVLMQEGKSQGLGSLSGQASTDTFFNKHKARTKEGMLVRITTALVVLFFALAIVLNIGSF